METIQAKDDTVPRPPLWSEEMWWRANLLVIAVGILLRLWVFLGGRSLWLDEVFAVMNFQKYSFLELFQPAEIPHWSPIGFLACTRLLILLGGDSEYVYRLIPLLVGCASLFLYYRLAREFLRPATTLYCNLLFTLSETLRYYSNEFKPYILDVAAGILLTLLLRPFFQKALPHRQALLIGLGGALLVWFSYTITFVMAGVGSVLFLRFFRQGDSGSLKQAALMTSLWIGSFLINYFIFLQHIPAIPSMVDHWSRQNDYMTFFPRSEAEWRWILNSALHYFDDVGGFRRMGPFLLVCYGVGCVHFLYRKAYYSFLCLCLPIFAVLVASSLKLYPFSGRLVLFTVPYAVIMVGAAFDLLPQVLEKRASLYACLLMGLSLIPPGVIATRAVLHGEKVSETREVLLDAADYIKPDDIFICYMHHHAYLYYLRKYDIHDSEPRELTLKELESTLTELDNELEDASVWLGFGFVREADRETILKAFRQNFSEVRTFTDVRASLHQFQRPRASGQLSGSPTISP